METEIGKFQQKIGYRLTLLINKILQRSLHYTTCLRGLNLTV